jgi:hypothetical protein
MRPTIVLLTLWLLCRSLPAKEQVWRHESASALDGGRREGVVVTGSGRVRLAPTIAPVEGLEATRVWDLAATPDGSIWAATGDQGRIYRLRDGAWVPAHDAADTQVLCLASRGGRVAAGTGPGGLVIELDQAGEVLATGRPGPEVNYVWDLAYTRDGSLLAATGPQGQLWRRSAETGDWALLFDARQPHLLALAVDAEDAAYVGTDAGALIYRVTARGETTVVLDAPQEEIRSLRIAEDGTLLAGTASEIPGGPPARATTRRDEESGRFRRVAFQGTARLKAGATGENVVYRLTPGGPAREVFRFRGIALALAEMGGRVLVGTGPEGRLYEVGPDGDSAVLARLDHGQVMALLPGPARGELLLGAGDPGGVYRLGAGYLREGSLTSQVLDAGLPARFGALVARSETPPGTRVGIEVRTGQSGEPDATWSDWKPTGADAPTGRFAQYRLTLSTNDPAVSPEVTAVTLAYRTLNLAPEIGSITIPDVAAGDGATRRTKLELKWEASDPNDDPLVYTLAIRKDGWPDWVVIPTPAPLTEKAFSWDAATVPSGRYRLRVTARDHRGNAPSEALDGSRDSEPFLIDHVPPAVTIDATRRPLRVVLEDELSRVTAAEYSLDGGEWRSVFAIDGLFDTGREAVEIALPSLEPGPHVVVVRATDAGGNVGSADAVFTVPAELP